MAEPIEPAASPEFDTPENGTNVRPDPLAPHSGGASPEAAESKLPGAFSPNESGGIAWVENDSPDRAAADERVKNIAWPRLARAEYQPEPSAPSATSKSTGTPFHLWMWVAAQICGFGLLLGGYFLGQAWAPRARPGAARNDAIKTFDPTAQKSFRAGSERALDAADRALKAERSHDFQAARAIYEEMSKRQAPLVGAEYRLALISLHEGDFPQTEVHLNRSLHAGEAVGDCYLLLASLAGMKSNFADASIQMAAAVRAQPFSAKFLFCWGEALRRDNHFPEALQHLEEALNRPDNNAARELYSFKLRLAKVETGHDALFDSEVARHLAEPTPGGDWLLLAAAQEIGRKNDAAASSYLAKAKAVLPQEVFANYLQDYFFQSRRTHPELATLLNVPPPVAPPAPDAPLQDPAVWTAAEADPAAWPPFPLAD